MRKTSTRLAAINRLAGQGGARPLEARWVVTAEAVLESAAHFGGQGDGLTDMPLIRDLVAGLPLLPGTSLAGALRGYLTDFLAGYRSPEPSLVTQLFGTTRGQDVGAQSPLMVFDSLGYVPGGQSIEIRDGVSIDSATGTTQDHKKFDFEVLPPGTVFRLRLELLVEDTQQEADLLGLLRTSLKGLESSELTIGMRRSRGLGRFSARNWRAYRYDFERAGGWMKWLLSDPEVPIPHEIGASANLDSTLESAWPNRSWTDFSDRREAVICDLVLRQETAVLVRSPGISREAADVAHLTSGGRPVLPGTSLAGVLRSRMLRIARVVRASQGDAEAWVNALFGARTNEDSETSAQLRSSRIRITESFLEGGRPVRPSRVQIDRFTQGVMPAALFDEEPWWGAQASIRIELRNPQKGEAGLLMLLLKDLLSGDLPLGGAASVGRGLFTGQARIRFPDGSQANLRPESAPPNDVLARLDREIRELHEALEPNGGNEVANG